MSPPGRRSDRIPLGLAAVSIGLAFSAACGPQQAGPGAQSAQEGVVVVPPSDTAAVTPPDGPAQDAPTPRKADAGDVEECIKNLRSGIREDDPQKAAGEPKYRAALAAERDGQKEAARKGYFNVISDHPASTFVPPSYFAFGEMFMAESTTDAMKVQFAEQSYTEVLKFPPPLNKLRAVALYRVGVLLSESAPLRAMAALARAAKTERESPGDGCAAEVSVAALAALVPVFMEEGEPAKSWPFFVGLAGGGARAAGTTLALAERYVAAKKPDAAAACLLPSVEPGARAQPDAAARAGYCKRVKQVAAAARAGATASVAALDRVVAAECP
jgi:TolA-binding protein